MREKAKRIKLAIFNMDKTYLLRKRKDKVLEAELCLMYALDDGLPHSQKEISDAWSIPRTTMNTIIKRKEREGYLNLIPIPGKRREKQIVLTETGKQYAQGILGEVYRAEDKALSKTLQRYPEEFISALEYFVASLKEAFREEQKVHELQKQEAVRR